MCVGYLCVKEEYIYLIRCKVWDSFTCGVIMQMENAEADVTESLYRQSSSLRSK